MCSIYCETPGAQEILGITEGLKDRDVRMYSRIFKSRREPEIQSVSLSLLREAEKVEKGGNQIAGEEEARRMFPLALGSQDVFLFHDKE